MHDCMKGSRQWESDSQADIYYDHHTKGELRRIKPRNLHPPPEPLYAVIDGLFESRKATHSPLKVQLRPGDIFAIDLAVYNLGIMSL